MGCNDMLRQPPTWTEKRLSTFLSRLVGEITISHKLCFFIDGLDEFEGDLKEMLSLIDDISLKNVKICLSSRPLPRIEDRFSSSAMLRMQDLTRADITHYVSDKLFQASSPDLQSVDGSDWKPTIINQITERAEGVFLWVNLAVNDLLEGMYNHDNPQQLQKRLERFPTQLKQIYERILRRIDPIYRTEVTQYIMLVYHDHRDSLTLTTLCLATYLGLDDLIRLYQNSRPSTNNNCGK